MKHTLGTAKGYPLKGAVGTPTQVETVDLHTQKGRAAGRRLGMRMPSRDQVQHKKPKKTPRFASGAPRGWSALTANSDDLPRVVRRG